MYINMDIKRQTFLIISAQASISAYPAEIEGINFLLKLPVKFPRTLCVIKMHNN